MRSKAPPEKTTEIETPVSVDDAARNGRSSADARPVQAYAPSAPAAGAGAAGNAGTTPPASPGKDQDRFPWEGPWNRSPAYLPSPDGKKFRREEEETPEA